MEHIHKDAITMITTNYSSLSNQGPPHKTENALETLFVKAGAKAYLEKLSFAIKIIN
jgi:hypothetical protein